MDATINEIPVPKVSQTQSKKKGFTLTEIAIVLGIIGLILGAVWSAASGVYASQKASSFTQQMTLYIAAVRGACNGSCNSAPAVTQAIPTVSNAQATGTVPTATAYTNADAYVGGVQLAYTGINTGTAPGAALANGLIGAANATGSVLSDAAGSIPVATVACASGKLPVCTPSDGNYTSVEGGSVNCTGTTTVLPVGDTCSNVLTLSKATSIATLYFTFAPSF